MSNFHDDPTIEGTTGNVNPDETTTDTPYIPTTDDNLELEYAPLRPSRAARAPGHFRRWLVAGGLAAALGVGAVGGGALALAHANDSSAPGGAVAATSPAPGTHHRGPGHFGHRALLTVTSVNGQAITATRPDGAKVTIHTSSSTVYTRAGQTVSASTVKSGDHIRVRGTRNSDGSITATHIVIVLPGYAGTVTVVSGNTITVKNRAGTTHTIDMSASTRYYQGRGHTAQSSSLRAIKVGDRLAAEGTLNSDGSLNAQVVYFGPARSATPSSGTAPSGVPSAPAPSSPAGL